MPLDFLRNFVYPYFHNSIGCKPMTGISNFSEHAQRAAGGGIAVWTDLLNGLLRAALKPEGRKYKLTETATVTWRRICLYTEKEGFVPI